MHELLQGLASESKHTTSSEEWCEALGSCCPLSALTTTSLSFHTLKPFEWKSKEKKMSLTVKKSEMARRQWGVGKDIGCRNWILGM